MKISDVKVNTAAAAIGRWIGDLPDLGDIKVFVRGMNNAKYRRLQQSMVRALPPSKRRAGVVDPLEMDRINGICLARHSLSDWRNIEDEAGQPLAFSVEVAEKMLTDPDMKKLRDGVFMAASQVEDEDEEENQATEKNSDQPSGTV